MISNSNHTLNFTDLLSSSAHILHRTRRQFFEKRIVDICDKKYVLYRFSSARTLKRFVRILALSESAGVSLQKIHDRTSTWREGLCIGNWAALTYEDGDTLTGEAPPTAMISLGKNLGRLHTIEGTRRHGLFSTKLPNIPYKLFVTDSALDPGVVEWVNASQLRLESIKKYHLTHGDLYGKNVIVKPDWNVVFIDYELFAFDIAGIELAGVLLNPYCRKRANRNKVINSYLSNCSQNVEYLWNNFSSDFLFAAAIKHWSLKNRRVNYLKRQISWLRFYTKFTMPHSQKMEVIKKQLLENDELIKRTISRANFYFSMAQIIANVCARGIIRDVSHVITVSYDELYQLKAS